MNTYFKKLVITLSVGALLSSQALILPEAQAATMYVDTNITVDDEGYTAIDFQAPRAGDYQVSFFTDGDEVGGVAVVVADPG